MYPSPEFEEGTTNGNKRTTFVCGRIPVILFAKKFRNEVCGEDTSFVLSALSAGLYSAAGNLRHSRATVGRRNQGGQWNSRNPFKSEDRRTEGRTDERKEPDKKEERERNRTEGDSAGLLRDASVSNMDVIRVRRQCTMV